MAAYNQELDKVLWKGDSILFKNGKSTLTVQIASYNGSTPKIYVREEGSFKGWQIDEEGNELRKEKKQIRVFGRPYIRRMEYETIKNLLPDMIEGIKFLQSILKNYEEEK